MRTFVILIFLLIFLFSGKIYGDTTKSQSDSLKDQEGIQTSGRFFPDATSRSLKRALPNNAFGVGERFVYNVRYGPIHAGTAMMEVAEAVNYNGHKTFRIKSFAKSSKFFSPFFKVDDRVESIMDFYGLFSHHFEKHLKEGSYRADRFVDFDQKNRLAYEGADTIPVPEFVLDALASLYYIRTLDLKVGNSVFINNYSDKKNYALEVKVLKKEEVKVPAGRFFCVVVEPILQASGIFKHEGKLKVWLTDDKYKIPVKMKSKVAVGSITTELKSYTLGKIGK